MNCRTLRHALVLAAFAVLPALHAGAAATRTLFLGLPVSAGTPIKDSIEGFGRDVERRTGGALRIATAGGDRHYEDDEVISAVSSGAVELGTTSLNQFAYDVPMAGVFLQPFMFNYDALVRASARPGSEIRSLVDDEIRYWTNTRVLSWLPRGAAVIFSRRVADLDPAASANRQVGASDDLTKDLTKACGGSPHLMPPSDLYGALENDTIQLTMADIFSVTERDLWRVADTIVNTRHSPSLFIVIVNDKVWDSLPPDQRQVLTDASDALQERTWDAFSTIEADAYAFAANKGMKVYEPTARDIVAWRQCSAPLLESYVDRIGKLGPRLFTAYGRLRTDPCCNSPQADQMPADMR
jgi:C4-dicarboxylate-binding protein DctP